MAVLITGATGGLGRAFADVYAEHGFDLVLVARNPQKLKHVQTELEKQYKVRVTTICEDLTDESSAKRIYEKTMAHGIDVTQLVNNAGCGHMASVADCDPGIIKNIITLNITTLTLLSHYYAADMQKKGTGKILLVSSLGAFQPDPYFNVYGPSKAYELYLGATMYGELKDSGVTISVLCPGPVKTNWAKNAGKKDSRFARDAKLIAEIGFKGTQRGKLVIVPTIPYKIERFIATVLPKTAMARIVGKWQSNLGQAKGA